MTRISASMFTDARAYTRSKAPWVMDGYRPGEIETASGLRFGRKLLHYISGGGMRSFGRSVEQEERDIKRRRFLSLAAVLAAAWLALLFC